MEKTCAICGTTFEAATNRIKYCEPCRIKRGRKTGVEPTIYPERKCIICGGPFIPASDRHVTCSAECRKEYETEKRRKQPKDLLRMPRGYAKLFAPTKEDGDLYRRFYNLKDKDGRPDKLAQDAMLAKHFGISYGKLQVMYNFRSRNSLIGQFRKETKEAGNHENGIGSSD